MTAVTLMQVKLEILTKMMIRSKYSLDKEKRDVFGTSALAVWKAAEKNATMRHNTL